MSLTGVRTAPAVPGPNRAGLSACKSTVGTIRSCWGTPQLGMAAIDPAIFKTYADIHLRVWFSDGVAAFQEMTPHRPSPPSRNPQCGSSGWINQFCEVGIDHPYLPQTRSIGPTQGGSLTGRFS